MNWLTFADWVSQRGNLITDGWIIVADSLERGAEHRLTTSVLVSKSDGERCLRAEFQGFDTQAAASAVVEDFVGNQRRHLREPSRDEGGGSRPFVLHRYHHGYTPPRFDLVQAFEVYWNGFWEDGTLRWIDTNGEVHDLARLRSEGDRRLLEVDAHHLRAFLNVADSVLLRSHMHRRFSKSHLSDRIERNYQDETGHFEITADNMALSSQDGSSALGEMAGRDLVHGYDNLDDDPRVPKALYETFLVGRGKDGLPLNASSDPQIASSSFTDRGTDHFLTQVFFRAAVLARYYADPRRFRIENDHVPCLDLWSIRFERSTDDLVWVYLGDLGRLPFPEQRIWRTLNVLADEDVSPERFAQDFMAEWTTRAPDPVYDFLRGIEGVNAAAVAAYGKPLFRPLAASDEHVRTGLRIPLSDNPEEADTQITAMAKMVVEPMDTGLLRSLVPADFETKNKSSLKLLEGVLSAWHSPSDVSSVMTPFFNLYYLRSTGSAHLRGSSWEKTLEQTGLAGLGVQDLVRQAMEQSVAALQVLQKLLIARVVPATSGSSSAPTTEP